MAGKKPLSTSEFNLTVQAKNGDASANLELWKRYKPLTVSILKKVPGISYEDKLSEGYEVFLHKLEYFNPEKVMAIQNTFSFGLIMIGGLKNLKLRLITRWKKEIGNVSYITFDDDCENGLDKVYPCLVLEFGNFEHRKYVQAKARQELFDMASPENTMFQLTEDDLKSKEQLLYSKLTDFQKDILKLKQEGRTLKEIASILDCSLTTIKNHCVVAKSVAAKIFGERPELCIKTNLQKYGKKQIMQMIRTKQLEEINANKNYMKSFAEKRKTPKLAQEA